MDTKGILHVYRWYRLNMIGMMISNNQMMILGLTLITFIVVNSWVSGHGDIEVQRTLSATICTKG